MHTLQPVTLLQVIMRIGRSTATLNISKCNSHHITYQYFYLLTVLIPQALPGPAQSVVLGIDPGSVKTVGPDGKLQVFALRGMGRAIELLRPISGVRDEE